MATHSSILAREGHWTEELGGLQSIVLHWTQLKQHNLAHMHMLPRIVLAHKYSRSFCFVLIERLRNHYVQVMKLKYYDTSFILHRYE